MPSARVGDARLDVEHLVQRDQRQVLAAHLDHAALAGDLLDVGRAPAAATRPRSPAAGCRSRRRQRIDMPSRIASVSGSEIRIVVPKPSAERMSTVPPSAVMLRLTTSMPTPRPETSVTMSAVEKPGAKISCQTSASRHVVGHRQAVLRAPWPGCCSRFRPPPSSRTSITMLPPWWAADRNSVPGSDLPAATRAAGSLDAVVDRSCAPGGSADRRCFSIRPLSSSVASPLRDEVDLLAQLAGQVAHHAREAREHEVHRHHADRHHRFLQVAGVAGQLARPMPAGAGAASDRGRRCAARAWPG